MSELATIEADTRAYDPAYTKRGLPRQRAPKGHRVCEPRLPPADPEDRIALPMVPRRLAEMTGKPAPDYHWLADRMRNGTLPAVRGGNNGKRWYVLTKDLVVLLVLIEDYQNRRCRYDNAVFTTD